MSPLDEHRDKTGRLSRRRFLKGLAAGMGATVLAACGAPNPAVEPATTSVPAAATSAPAAVAETSVAATSAPAAETTTAVAAAAAPPAATVSSFGSGSVTLTLMYNENEFSNAEIQTFIDKNPGIKIERVPWEGAGTRFKAMLAAGKPPDVFRTDGFTMPSLVKRDVCLDLTDRFQQSEALKADNLAPPIKYYTVEGKIYGLAKDWSPDHSMFAYNTAFEEAGLPVPDPTKALTYGDIAQMAPKLTKREGNRTLRVGWTYEAGWFARTIERILAEQGEKMYAPDFSKVILKDNPKAVEAIKYFYDRSKENVTWNPLNPDPSWIGDDFTKGLVGLVSYGYWFSGMLAATTDSPVLGKVTMLPAPTWAGKRLNPTVTAAGTAVAKATKNPDAAWKLFEYYCSGEPAVARAKSGWGIPALKSLYPLMPSQTPFQKQVQTVLQDELKYANESLDVNPYYEDTVFTTSWTKNLEQALRGTISFDQLVANIEKEVNTAIDEGKTSYG